MIQIDRMRMRLPSGFEHRAMSITQQIGKVLEKTHISGDAYMEAISLSSLKIHAGTSDEEIAEMIANQIVELYEGGSR